MKYLITLILVSGCIKVYSQCVSSVSSCASMVELGGNLNTQIVESSNWIKICTSGATVVSNQSVKLDAEPINGYIEINPGFQAFPTGNGVFIAQALNGCATGIPAKPGGISNLSGKLENQSVVVIYPNPTSGIFYVNVADLKHGKIQVFNNTGALLIDQQFNVGPIVKVDIRNLPTETYTVKIVSDSFGLSKKIIKE